MIVKKRKKHIEKKTFDEKRETLEEFFKTKVDIMLESKKIIYSVHQREEKRAVDRKCYRELKYKMDPYEWALVKLSNGKTKAIIVEERKEYKNWEWTIKI
jgi:hypothetical protein